jgi:hypothetical protein
VKRCGLFAGVIAALVAATSTGFAQHPSPVANTKPLPAAPSPALVAHPPVAPAHGLGTPARNAIGLAAPAAAANPVGTMREPGVGANIGAARPGPAGLGQTRPNPQPAAAAPLTARGALHGSQMGRPMTGAAMLGGAATHAPTATIGHNNASVKH